MPQLTKLNAGSNKILMLVGALIALVAVCYLSFFRTRETTFLALANCAKDPSAECISTTTDPREYKFYGISQGQFAKFIDEQYLPVIRDTERAQFTTLAQTEVQHSYLDRRISRTGFVLMLNKTFEKSNTGPRQSNVIRDVLLNTICMKHAKPGMSKKEYLIRGVESERKMLEGYGFKGVMDQAAGRVITWDEFLNNLRR